jgi:hypothetical protein
MDFDRAIRFLVERGAAAPEHNSGVTLLEHITGTYRVLERWGFSDDVLAAGLFHSVYSTQNFPLALASYDERSIVREIAGVDGERLAFLFCVKRSDSLFSLAARVTHGESGELRLADWRTGETHAVSAHDVTALVNLVAANALEQAPRDGATLHRDGPALRDASRLLVSAAKREFAVRATVHG